LEIRVAVYSITLEMHGLITVTHMKNVQMIMDTRNAHHKWRYWDAKKNLFDYIYYHVDV